MNGFNGFNMNGLNGFNGLNVNGLNGFNGLNMNRFNGMNGFNGFNGLNMNWNGLGAMGLLGGRRRGMQAFFTASQIENVSHISNIQVIQKR